MSSQSVGRYEIKAELGRGGMAVVYHAYDPSFKRDVAIKVLPREFLHDPSFRTRFEREAHTIATLEHTAIVPVYDYGEHNGQLYLVMRYMPGGSLKDRIIQGAMSLGETAAVVQRVAAALDAAHSLGIIHRDVKPANILFDQFGDAYLSDFGIVKLAEASAQLTGSGIVGTPAYMAPEMTERGSTTPLIDIYALGVTLFEMVTGQLPFDSDTPMGLLMAHATKPVPNAQNLKPDLPDDVQDIIDWAMAKKPAERYQTAGALAEDFRGIKSDSAQVQPVTMRPLRTITPSTKEITDLHEIPPTRSSQRRTSWLWGAGVAGVMVVVVVVLSLLGVFSGGSPDGSPDSEQDANAASDGTQPPDLANTPASAETPGSNFTQREDAIQLALAGAITNGGWMPYTEEINGVHMALVPAGCFRMGSTDEDIDYAVVLSEDGTERSWFYAEQPAHEVCFDEPFWIDVYEVTNQEYGDAAADCAEWSSEGNQPRICITWADSLAYCEGRGARLPTEAELEYTARGPDSLGFPWGNDFVADNVVYSANSGGITAQVGSRPGGVSWVGVFDLGGNVYEWAGDWYDESFYGTLSGGAVNPQGPDTGDLRVIRGGSWSGSGPAEVRGAARGGLRPIDAVRFTGFRCALSWQP